MYSLLNYIAATSKEIQEGASVTHYSSIYENAEFASSLMDTGLHGLSEDEKRLVGITTISIVTRLALEFKMEEVKFMVYLADPR
jgi:phosphatidylinositol 4-kinase